MASVEIAEFFLDWPSHRIALALRARLQQWVPRYHEKVQSGWGILSVRAGPTFADRIGWIAPKEWGVHLGFGFGVELPDPSGLLIALSGTNSPARNVRITTPEEVDAPVLRTLVDAAVRFQLGH